METPGEPDISQHVHSARELRSSMFRIELAGRAARLEDVFEGFGEHDRLGLVMRRPCGAVGASALIAAAITAFYDIQRSRGTDFFIYPDYYLFHVGGPLGDHARLDVWPSRKEVVVEDDPARILEAIDDRAISRLLVEDGPRGDAELDAEAVASARARVSSCLAYSASGRVERGRPAHREQRGGRGLCDRGARSRGAHGAAAFGGAGGSGTGGGDRRARGRGSPRRCAGRS